MPDIPTKKEIVGIMGAQATSIDSISERLVRLEKLIEKQDLKNQNLVDKLDSKNQNIVIGVVVAFILIVGTVAVEVILSNKKDAQFYSGLEKNIFDQNLKVQDLGNTVDNLKIRNYLR